MNKQASNQHLAEKTSELFDEFRIQLLPEQGFNVAEFEHKLRETLDTANQQEFDDAIDELCAQTDVDAVLVYYLDNLRVRRPEVLQWLANVYHSESYDDPDLPTNRGVYWRDFYESSSPSGLINEKLNGD